MKSSITYFLLAMLVCIFCMYRTGDDSFFIAAVIFNCALITSIDTHKSSKGK